MRGSKKKAELPKPPPDPVLLVEHFKTQLTTHSSSAIHAQAIADEALAKVRALELELVEREKRTDDIASELTRTHKEYVSSMTARVNALEAEVERLNEELAAEKAQHQETIYQKDLEIAKKEADIVKMHERMEELINECGDMIADSIRRLNDRIDLVGPSMLGGGQENVSPTQASGSASNAAAVLKQMEYITETSTGK